MNDKTTISKLSVVALILAVFSLLMLPSYTMLCHLSDALPIQVFFVAVHLATPLAAIIGIAALFRIKLARPNLAGRTAAVASLVIVIVNILVFVFVVPRGLSSRPTAEEEREFVRALERQRNQQIEKGPEQ